MADKIILVDTSILIDYYRKTDKEKSVWISLVRQAAVANNIPLATLNKKHFERIDGLKLID